VDDMMRTFWILAFSGIIMMSGCDNTTDLIPSDQLNVQAILQDYEGLLSIDKTDLRNSKATIAMEAFSLLPDNTFKLPFNLNIENISFYYANSRTTGGNNDQEMFDYTNRIGVYHWNSIEGQFEKVPEEVNYIQLEFPSINGGQDNNASLLIKEYAEIGLTVLDGPISDQVFEITAFEAILRVDENVELTINYHAEFDNAGDLIDLTMEAFINPFELTIFITQNNGVMQINSRWDKQQKPIFSSYFLIAKNNINFTPYDGFTFNGKTSGHIKYRQLKLDGSFDFSKIEIEKQDKGDAVQMALYQGSKKLGSLCIDYQTEGEQIVPGSMKYFVETQNKFRISADGVVKPLFEGFNNL
jgi:hypothetical protein